MIKTKKRKLLFLYFLAEWTILSDLPNFMCYVVFILSYQIYLSNIDT